MDEFMDAVIDGDADYGEILIANGVDVNSIHAGGKTALIWAASKGHISVVQLLLSAGADVNAVARGRTALIWAAYYGYLSIVELLIIAGTNVNAADTDGMTALMGAAYEGHLSVVNMMISAGADVNAASTYGSTALMWAAHNGHVSIVELLLSSGADVQTATIWGETALMGAVNWARTDVVELLLKQPCIHSTVNAIDTEIGVMSTDIHNINAVRLCVDRWHLGQNLCNQATTLHYDKLLTLIKNCDLTTNYMSHIRDSDGFTILGRIVSTGADKNIIKRFLDSGLSAIVYGTLDSSLGTVANTVKQYYTADFLYYMAVKEAARKHPLFNTVRSMLVVGAKNLPIDIIDNILTFCTTQSCFFVYDKMSPNSKK